MGKNLETEDKELDDSVEEKLSEDDPCSSVFDILFNFPTFKHPRETVIDNLVKKYEACQRFSDDNLREDQEWTEEELPRIARKVSHCTQYTLLMDTAALLDKGQLPAAIGRAEAAADVLQKWDKICIAFGLSLPQEHVRRNVTWLADLRMALKKCYKKHGDEVSWKTGHPTIQVKPKKPAF